MEILRYRLMGDNKRALPGHSTEMPRPGETLEQAKQRLRDEYGGRLIELNVIRGVSRGEPT